MSEDIDKEALRAEQRAMAQQVQIPTHGGYAPSPGDLVLAMDIQYKGDAAHVSGDLHRFRGEHVGTWAGVTPASFPYIPGYFCFREGPPLLAMVRRLQAEDIPTPDVIIIDGHGIAHPRRFGVASWMGVQTDLPTIGCAKRALIPFKARPELTQRHWSPVLLEDETVGAVLCTQTSIKPVFVSPGHKTNLEDAVETVLGLGGQYRVPDPIRRADQACRAHSRGEQAKDWTPLGDL
jgi:deoxyribonuclease V